MYQPYQGLQTWSSSLNSSSLLSLSPSSPEYAGSSSVIPAFILRHDYPGRSSCLILGWHSGNGDPDEEDEVVYLQVSAPISFILAASCAIASQIFLPPSARRKASLAECFLQGKVTGSMLINVAESLTSNSNYVNAALTCYPSEGSMPPHHSHSNELPTLTQGRLSRVLAFRTPCHWSHHRYQLYSKQYLLSQSPLSHTSALGTPPHWSHRRHYHSTLQQNEILLPNMPDPLMKVDHFA